MDTKNKEGHVWATPKSAETLWKYEIMVCVGEWEGKTNSVPLWWIKMSFIACQDCTQWATELMVLDGE